MSLDDADIYLCYRYLWMTDKERLNAAYYGIHVDDGGNTAKIRLGAGDAVAATQPDASIAAAFITGLPSRSILRFSRIMARSTRLG